MGQVLSGLPVSGGEVVGRARVLKNLSPATVPDPDNSDILLLDFATPMISRWLPQAIGIAAVSGGPTSHAAILAREAGIPAVLGIAGLLDLVEDGQLVRLNGSTGELAIID